jgi:hypothetical protein
LGRIGDWYFLAILGLAALGAPSFLHRDRPRRLFFLLATMCLASTPILLFGDPRYKVPATPLLSVMAAVGLVATVDHARHWRARRQGTGAGLVPSSSHREAPSERTLLPPRRRLGPCGGCTIGE